ncbi:hypothetical protein [Dactylosporangium cerinum]
MAVDLTALLVTAAGGRTVPMYGAQLVYPVAGLLIMYAVFKYPTTAQHRSERLRLGLDAAIVLVGVATRRPFSVLPYGASAAAFGLLVIVVGPDLDWRRWGSWPAPASCWPWSRRGSSPRCGRTGTCSRGTGSSPSSCSTRRGTTS